MIKYKIPNEKHLENNWLVQKLAYDFELLDVWEFPIISNSLKGESLYKFRKHAIEPTLKNTFNFSITGLLFLFRGLIGEIFQIDKNVNKLPIPNCIEISLADRMNKKELNSHSPKLDIDLRTDNYFDFRTVYSLENETLNEISNSTEHSLMHYAYVKIDDHKFKIQMASYVKHRSKYGKYYISLIRPFKYWIVYPYLFDNFVKKWNNYIQQTQSK